MKPPMYRFKAIRNWWTEKGKAKPPSRVHPFIRRVFVQAVDLLHSAAKYAHDGSTPDRQRMELNAPYPIWLEIQIGSTIQHLSPSLYQTDKEARPDHYLTRLTNAFKNWRKQKPHVAQRLAQTFACVALHHVDQAMAAIARHDAITSAVNLAVANVCLERAQTLTSLSSMHFEKGASFASITRDIAKSWSHRQMTSEGGKARADRYRAIRAVAVTEAKAYFRANPRATVAAAAEHVAHRLSAEWPDRKNVKPGDKVIYRTVYGWLLADKKLGLL